MDKPEMYPPQYPPPPGFIPPSGHSAPPPYSGTPQQQYIPQQAAPPGVVFVHQTAFGPDTQAMTCPHCQASISTRVTEESNTKTHLFALLLCVLGCWPCVFCPYCVDSCLVKKHYCPSCNSFLGQYEN